MVIYVPRDPECPTGYDRASSKAVGVIQDANLGSIIKHVRVQTASGKVTTHNYVPIWANAIATQHTLGLRKQIAALVKVYGDVDLQARTTTLLMCIDEDDRRMLVEELALEHAQTIVCACRKKFLSSVEWRHHTESCPARRGA